MALPSQIIEQGNEDTSSIEDDLDTLYARFITPIENIRSKTSTIPANLNSADKSSIMGGLTILTSGVESRAHAFYRMLGLPIMDGSGNYYSSGFNPNITNQTSRDSINTAQNSQDLTSAVSRENWTTSLQTIFNNQDTTASVYSLMIGLHPKPFNTFTNPTTQSYSVPDRTLDLQFFTSINTNLATDLANLSSVLSASPITPDLDGGLHVLAPFTVNPLLDFTVMPVNNLIAAPFLLDVNAVRSSAGPEILHLRPAIEDILRQRLTDTTPDPFFLTNLTNVLQQQTAQTPTFNSTLDVPTLTETLFALADQNNISSLNVSSIFQNTTTTESETIEGLIQIIKVMVDLLRESVAGLEVVRTKFNFIPIPSTTGPETIGTIKDAVPTSQLDVSILTLTIQQLAGNSGPVQDPTLGDFASPFSSTLQKTPTYASTLDSKTAQRDKLGKKALGYLRTIEIITGEVSGLGLIDILAIYLALWSMDLQDVLGLIDVDAFNRLYNNNPNLQVGPVASKTQTPVKTALTTLTTRVTNILSFADKLYTDTLTSPTLTQGGSI